MIWNNKVASYKLIVERKQVCRRSFDEGAAIFLYCGFPSYLLLLSGCYSFRHKYSSSPWHKSTPLKTKTLVSALFHISNRNDFYGYVLQTG